MKLSDFFIAEIRLEGDQNINITLKRKDGSEVKVSSVGQESLEWDHNNERVFRTEPKFAEELDNLICKTSPDETMWNSNDGCVEYKVDLAGKLVYGITRQDLEHVSGDYVYTKIDGCYDFE